MMMIMMKFVSWLGLLNGGEVTLCDMRCLYNIDSKVLLSGSSRKLETALVDCHRSAK